MEKVASFLNKKSEVHVTQDEILRKLKTVIYYTGTIAHGFIGTKKISGDSSVELEKIISNIDIDDKRNTIFVSTRDDNFRLVRGKWYREEKTTSDNDDYNEGHLRRWEDYAHGDTGHTYISR